MEFNTPLVKGTLIQRYKRFLADVRLECGNTITAHTPNTGSMQGCCTPGSQVWLRNSGNPGRKYPYSWELVESRPGILTGINTGLANLLVKEAIQQGVIVELQGYTELRTEVRYGKENSRIDILLSNGSRQSCYVEVKNVTLVEEDIALFPDAVSKRGSKHLRELEQMVNEGHRGIIFYCVQRQDASEVRPADNIDPEYGKTLRTAMQSGVEALAYQAEVSPVAIKLKNSLPVNCPDL